MTILFISHSSRDADIAWQVKERLAEQGYVSVFLDFDPQTGLEAGVQWQEEIYRQLRICRGLIALVSADFLASRWCFAEVTRAREQGKAIFPVLVGPGEQDDGWKAVLNDRQMVVDLTVDPEEGYERLLRGLKRAGLDPRDSFAWDPQRPPYPGLLSFQRADAAVFFGREQDVSRVMNAVEHMRRHGEPRLAVVLGPSGSGKSSLVRAGVLPRLGKDRERWRVLSLLRPGAPLPKPPTTDADVVSVLVIDQLEEAFLPRNAGGRFWQELRELLASPEPLLVLATLRSDYLGQLQREGLPFENVLLDPLPRDALSRVIAQPAARAGVDFEEGLESRLIDDTATDDALPLLAFTLRELWERRWGEKLTFAAYEKELGGIEGAVGRVANEIAGAGKLSADQEHALRSAFLKLVRVGEDGSYLRQRASWRQMPEAALPILDPFVTDRLLVKGVDEMGEATVELAHEALFRVWPRLADWLTEEREFLLFRRRFRSRRDDWEDARRDHGALLRGEQLSEARRWAGQRPEEFDQGDAEFLMVSFSELYHEEDQRRRRRSLARAAVALVMLFAAFAVWQWWTAELQRTESERQQRLAEARELSARSLLSLEPSVLMSLAESARLAIESLARMPTNEGMRSWAEVMRRLPKKPPKVLYTVEPGKDGPLLRALAFSPDGRYAFISQDGDAPKILQVDVDTTKIVGELSPAATIRALTVDRSGFRLVAGHKGGTEIWDVRDRSRIAILPFAGDGGVAFSGDGQRLVLGSRQSEPTLLSTADWQPLAFETRGAAWDPSFSDDGEWIIMVGYHFTRLWKTAIGKNIDSVRTWSRDLAPCVGGVLSRPSGVAAVEVWWREERAGAVRLRPSVSSDISLRASVFDVRCRNVPENGIDIQVAVDGVDGAGVFRLTRGGAREEGRFPSMMIGLPQAVVFVPGRSAFGVVNSSSAVIWSEDAAPEGPLERWTGLDEPVNSVAFESPERWVFESHSGGTSYWRMGRQGAQFISGETSSQQATTSSQSAELPANQEWQLLANSLRQTADRAEVFELWSREDRRMIKDHAFSPDGNWLVVVDEEGRVYSTPLGPKEMIRRLCGRLRSLSSVELPEMWRPGDLPEACDASG